MKKTFTETYQQICFQLVGQHWVTCQSSVSHCCEKRTIITGFDTSELNPYTGGVDTGKLSKVLEADDRGEMQLGQVGQP